MSTSDSNLSFKTAGAGVFAATLASLCCITPVFSLLAGVGGIAAAFSWVEPFRPYLITLTVGILGFAWYHQLRPVKAEAIQCTCEDDEHPSFRQSKTLLSVITVFAVLMLAFPAYAYIFYPNSNSAKSSLVIHQDSLRTHKVVLKIKGMTCLGCENHIKYEVGKLQGIKSTEASYAYGTATIEYLPSKLDEVDIVNTINKIGYTVDEGDQSASLVEASDDISFYKVPLVCNAAPTIGCGSLAKPILQDFEKAESINEAWLNKSGTVIAIVWRENTNLKTRKDLINAVFTEHQINASELFMDNYATSYKSFSKREGWLRNADVDKLSEEEAEVFAEQILKPIKDKNRITVLQEEKLRAKVTYTFYDFFLNYESLQELSDAKVYRAKLGEIISYGEELLGNGSMPSVDELWNACLAASEGCSHEGCSGSSCGIPKKL